MSNSANKVYIFLDMDGVCNSMRSLLVFRSYAPSVSKLDPIAVGLVDRLVHELREARGNRLDPCVVISSTWRITYRNVQWWRMNFPRWNVVGLTNERGYVNCARGRQVQDWINENAPNAPYVCIDDDSDFLPDQNLVRVDPMIGLTVADIDKAFTLLTGRRCDAFPRLIDA